MKNQLGLSTSGQDLVVDFVTVIYEACSESKDTKVLTMYKFFNLQKWQC
jgi:hypothetical protein